MQMTPNSMILFSAKILKIYAIIWSVVLSVWKNGWMIIDWCWMITKQKSYYWQCRVSEWVGTIEHTYRRFWYQIFKVKNLGIHFASDLASSSHVNALIQTMYLELRKIGKICHLINTDCATLLVSNLVISKLDYCNSLLAGLPSEKLKKLQTVQNNAARLV